MGPIKNPCCGEAKRRERAGGGKKKGRRGESTFETDGKAEGAVEREGGRGRRTCLEGQEGCSPFLFVFQNSGHPFERCRSTIGLSGLANKLTIVPRTRITFQREKQKSPIGFFVADNQVDQFPRTSRRSRDPLDYFFIGRYAMTVIREASKISTVNRPSFLASEKIGLRENWFLFTRSMGGYHARWRPATPREVLRIETSYLRVITDY